MSHEIIEAAAEKADLKPCPFCGAKAEWSSGEYGDGVKWPYIACSECEAMGPHISRDVLTYKDATVSAWNNRAENSVPET